MERAALTVLAVVVVQVAVDKVVLVLELEHEREDDEQLLDDVGVDLLAELDDRVPVLGDRRGLVRRVPLVEARDEAWDVEDLDVGLLLEAVRRRVLEVGQVGASVAVVAAARGRGREQRVSAESSKLESSAGDGATYPLAWSAANGSFCS